MKYIVTVRYAMERKINVHARNAEAAGKEAADVVREWKDVVAALPIKTEEQ